MRGWGALPLNIYTDARPAARKKSPLVELYLAKNIPLVGPILAKSIPLIHFLTDIYHWWNQCCEKAYSEMDNFPLPDIHASFV